MARKSAPHTIIRSLSPPFFSFFPNFLTRRRETRRRQTWKYLLKSWPKIWENTTEMMTFSALSWQIKRALIDEFSPRNLKLWASFRCEIWTFPWKTLTFEKIVINGKAHWVIVFQGNSVYFGVELGIFRWIRGFSKIFRGHVHTLKIFREIGKLEKKTFFFRTKFDDFYQLFHLFQSIGNSNYIWILSGISSKTVEFRPKVSGKAKFFRIENYDTPKFRILRKAREFEYFEVQRYI